MNALATALSIVAILVSLPALFLSVYAIVLLKSRELASEMADIDRHHSRDPLGSRELNSREHEMGPGMYDLDRPDDDANELLDDEGI